MVYDCFAEYFSQFVSECMKTADKLETAVSLNKLNLETAVGLNRLNLDWAACNQPSTGCEYRFTRAMDSLAEANNVCKWFLLEMSQIWLIEL